ncbi:hypothetical protein M3936_19750 [Sutcliffiella horikoshii]|uniref:hypothetical protein n=1 Tax=Sutcliffiella horikoshii TaxID=79883 RepID=UPI00203A83C8|nr:hypothetical protein [Sutcliffiella horikoshii]MCM3619809.1 hypothetical protein [Sutcliffiella horikoshii]
MKKLLASLLVLLLVIPTSVGYASYDVKNTYKGAKVVQIDSKGKKLVEREKHEKAELEVTSSMINSESATLEGKIHTKNKDIYDLQLDGELFVSRHSNNLAIGELTDKTGNFEVLYFGIDAREDKSKTLSFNNSMKSAKNLVKIYLLKKDTKDFYYFEIDKPSFLDGTYFEGNFELNNNKEAAFELENWYTKALEPIDFTVEEVIEEDNLSSDEFSILNTRRSTYTSRNYTATYTVLGEYVFERIQLRHYLAYDDAPASTLNTWTTKLSVTSKSTSSVIPDYNGNNSSMEVGRYGSATIRAKTSTYEGIDSMSWAASATKKQSTLQFNLGWKTDWSWSYGPVNYGGGYNKSQSYTSGNSRNFENYSSQGTRTAKNDYIAILDKVGQYYDATFQVGKFGGSGGSKTASVEFVYEVSCKNYYPYGGTYTVPLSASYTRR